MVVASRLLSRLGLGYGSNLTSSRHRFRECELNNALTHNQVELQRKMATQTYIFPPLSTASLQNPSKLATSTTLRLIRILALTQLLVSLILDLSIHWKGGRWITYFTNIGHSTIILYYITTLSFPLHHWKKTTYVLHTLALNMQLLIPLVYWSLLAQNFVHQSPLKQYLNVSAHAIATFLILIESACNKVYSLSAATLRQTTDTRKT